jgi:hypothetical protein
LDAPTIPSRAEILLSESLAIMAPLARALTAHGITYPRFAQALKQVFLDAARVELQRQGTRTTGSALSLRSGVHRKDVRAFFERGRPDRRGSRALSMATLVFAKWSSDPAYLHADGAPQPLPLRGRSGQDQSFEALTQSISKDFHPRSILDELVRLNLAVVEGDTARLQGEAFAPTEAFADLARHFGANVRDHVAASAENLLRACERQAPRFLERAAFAEGLSEASIEALDRLAREVWNDAADRMHEAAMRHLEADAGAPRPFVNQRMRFGIYLYSEPAAPAAGDENGV